MANIVRSPIYVHVYDFFHEFWGNMKESIRAQKKVYLNFAEEIFNDP